MTDELFEIQFMELSADSPAEEHAAFAMRWHESIMDSGRFGATHVEIYADDDMRDIISKMISLLACWVVKHERGSADFEDHILAVKAIVREGVFGLALYGLAEVVRRDLKDALVGGKDNDVLRLASLLSFICRDMRRLIEQAESGDSYEGIGLRVVKRE